MQNIIKTLFWAPFVITFYKKSFFNLKKIKNVKSWQEYVVPMQYSVVIYVFTLKDEYFHRYRTNDSGLLHCTKL